jgi:hypothetical protein
MKFFGRLLICLNKEAFVALLERRSIRAHKSAALVVVRTNVGGDANMSGSLNHEVFKLDKLCSPEKKLMQLSSNP